MVHSPAGFKNLCQRTTTWALENLRNRSPHFFVMPGFVWYWKYWKSKCGIFLIKKQELLSIIVPIKIHMLPRFQTPQWTHPLGRSIVLGLRPVDLTSTSNTTVICPKIPVPIEGTWRNKSTTCTQTKTDAEFFQHIPSIFPSIWELSNWKRRFFKHRRSLSFPSETQVQCLRQPWKRLSVGFQALVEPQMQGISQMQRSVAVTGWRFLGTCHWKSWVLEEYWRIISVTSNLRTLTCKLLLSRVRFLNLNHSIFGWLVTDVLLLKTPSLLWVLPNLLVVSLHLWQNQIIKSWLNMDFWTSFPKNPHGFFSTNIPTFHLPSGNLT